MLGDLERSIRRTPHLLAAVPRGPSDGSAERSRFEVIGLHGALPAGWVEVLVELRGRPGRSSPCLIVEGTPHPLARLPGGRAGGIVELRPGAGLSLEIADPGIEPGKVVA